jgi:transposase
MTRKPYSTDLNEREWQIIKPLLPAPNLIGSPRQVNLREIINAIFYLLDNGIKWRAMPHDFPPWQTVYDYYRRWVRTGRWEKINQVLAQEVRKAQGRDIQPSLILIDSQSVNVGEKGGLKKELMAIRKSRVANVIWR